MNAIGMWVRRPGRPWHDTESVVAGAAVTHCGRRLEPKPADERTFDTPVVDERCKGCRYDDTFRAVADEASDRTSV